MPFTFSTRTTQKTPGWLQQLAKRLAPLKRGKEVAVGFPRGKNGVGNPHYDNGASILEVAIWNNFGTETGIPPRPFMAMANIPMQARYREMCKDFAKRLNAGEVKPETFLEAAGAMGAAEVKKAIASGGFAPNRPSTVRRKGEGKKPLVDSGDMLNAVTWAVRDAT
jgi:hypothetical protein